MFTVLNFVFAAAVKFYTWLVTRGWPFGAGLLAYAVITGGFSLPEAVGLVTGGIVTLVCLWVRYKKRHPEKAKALKERYFPAKREG